MKQFQFGHPVQGAPPGDHVGNTVPAQAARVLGQVLQLAGKYHEIVVAGGGRLPGLDLSPGPWHAHARVDHVAYGPGYPVRLVGDNSRLVGVLLRDHQRVGAGQVPLTPAGPSLLQRHVPGRLFRTPGGKPHNGLPRTFVVLAIRLEHAVDPLDYVADRAEVDR